MFQQENSENETISEVKQFNSVFRSLERFVETRELVPEQELERLDDACSRVEAVIENVGEVLGLEIEVDFIRKWIEWFRDIRSQFKENDVEHFYQAQELVKNAAWGIFPGLEKELDRGCESDFSHFYSNLDAHCFPRNIVFEDGFWPGVRVSGWGGVHDRSAEVSPQRLIAPYYPDHATWIATNSRSCAGSPAVRGTYEFRLSPPAGDHFVRLTSTITYQVGAGYSRYYGNTYFIVEQWLQAFCIAVIHPRYIVRKSLAEIFRQRGNGVVLTDSTHFGSQPTKLTLLAHTCDHGQFFVRESANYWVTGDHGQSKKLFEKVILQP